MAKYSQIHDSKGDVIQEQLDRCSSGVPLTEIDRNCFIYWLVYRENKLRFPKDSKRLGIHLPCAALLYFF